jgi:hypothetical protein
MEIEKEASLLKPKLTREDSNASTAVGEVGYKHIHKHTFFIAAAGIFALFTNGIIPRIKTRARAYLFLFLVISLLLLATTGHAIVYGASASEWYEFIGIAFIFDVIFACLDELFFVMLDHIWNGRDDIRLYVHCLSGPAGYTFFTIYINTVHGYLEIRHSVVFWDTLMSMVILSLFIFVFRQFLTRSNYNSIIVDRFQGRLKQLETRMKILSLLASWHPDLSDETSMYKQKGKGVAEMGGKGKSGQETDEPGRATCNRSDESDENGLKSPQLARGFSFKKKNVAREVFKEIVEASKDVVLESQEVYLSFSLLHEISCCGHDNIDYVDDLLLTHMFDLGACRSKRHCGAPKTQELLANIAYFGRQSDEVENL